MRRGSRLAAIAASGALAVAAPAVAQPGHTAHPSHPAHPGHPAGSQKCASHNVAYIASGQFVSWAATQSGTGTWTGTITVHVTRSNHHAGNAKGTDVTYTLSNTKVTFGDGANPPAAGDPVHLVGKISEVTRHCTQPGTTSPVTVRKLHIRAVKS
ncbi:MAG: hypothetical protein ACTHMY_25350 [Solirubrobacteraceae bacterium]